MKRYHRRQTCNHTSPRRSPTMVTLHRATCKSSAISPGHTITEPRANQVQYHQATPSQSHLQIKCNITRPHHHRATCKSRAISPGHTITEPRANQVQYHQATPSQSHVQITCNITRPHHHRATCKSSAISPGHTITEPRANQVQYHQAGSDPKSTGEEKEGKTQKHIAQ